MRARESNTLRRFGAARGTLSLAGNTRALDCQSEVGRASADAPVWSSHDRGLVFQAVGRTRTSTIG
jgi:hypothetical protein